MAALLVREEHSNGAEGFDGFSHHGIHRLRPPAIANHSQYPGIREVSRVLYILPFDFLEVVEGPQFFLSPGSKIGEALQDGLVHPAHVFPVFFLFCFFFFLGGFGFRQGELLLRAPQ